jgi:putative ABC transport system substrate-binding protein
MGARVRRREFIALVGGAVLAGPRSVSAQPTKRSYRVGWISVSHGFAEPYAMVFVQRLGELGFVEGRNLTLKGSMPTESSKDCPRWPQSLRSSNVTFFFAVATGPILLR